MPAALPTTSPDRPATFMKGMVGDLQVDSTQQQAVVNAGVMHCKPETHRGVAKPSEQYRPLDEYS